MWESPRKKTGEVMAIKWAEGLQEEEDGREERRGKSRRKSYTMTSYVIYGFHPVIFCGIK
jgi:hypothetical protein